LNYTRTLPYTLGMALYPSSIFASMPDVDGIFVG